MRGVLNNLIRRPTVRRLLLPALRCINLGDIRIRHHYTGDSLRMHSFRHKGYWFHGRNRERETMDFFRRVLRPGDSVVEVGGHIGYITLYLAQLVGRGGQVVVFEPGTNNLRYLKTNVAERSEITVVEQAVSDQDGVADFFEEELTGQNNSLCQDYSPFADNKQRAHIETCYQRKSVETTRLDTFLANARRPPRLLKIDIEGAELLALQGAARMLAEIQPVLLIEVTSNQDQVFALLQDAGYQLFSDAGTRLTAPDDLRGNTCVLHSDKHAELITTLWSTGTVAAA